ncbi:uncharacterized protein [Amphiura filiformis]
MAYGPEGRAYGYNVKQTVAEPEKIIKAQAEEFNAPLAFDEAMCTFDWVKKTLEADYPGKKLIFCKDMASVLDGKYDALPKGFRHTFIIRDPVKVFISYRKMVMRLLAVKEEQQKTFHFNQTNTVDPKYIFGEMLDLLHYLQETGMESNPVVIDADDLQSHPESILRQYCEAVGIPFSSDLLQWESSDDIKYMWITSKTLMKTDKGEKGGFYTQAFASTKFEPLINVVPDRGELTPDVIQIAKGAEQYYKELYEMRLKP